MPDYIAGSALAEDFVWRDPDDISPSSTATVFEPEMAPRRTGLLDAEGRPLYRVEKRDPIGFRIR